MGLQVDPRKHTGNICLYRTIRQDRSPSFLKKNIKRFLKFHQERSPDRPFLLYSKPREMDPMATWTARGLEDSLIKDRALIINLKVVTNSQLKKSGAIKGTRRIEHIVDCALTIWDGHQNEQCKQSRACSIIEGEAEPWEATIAMVEPFAVDPYIFHKRPGNAVGALLSNFSMQIAIIPRETSVADWPPLSLQLPPAQIKETTDESGVTRYPFLVVNWQRLPQLPSEGQGLRIMARQDNKNLKTPLFVSLDANFTAPPAPLKTYNIKSLSKQSSRLQMSESPQRVPMTPSKSKEFLKPTINVRWFLPYGLEEIKDVEFQGYYCPICKSQHESVDGYHFHLISSHDLFKFRVDWKSTTIGDDQAKFEVKVQFKVNDKYANRASNSAPDPEELAWTRPKTLFKLDDFLRGEGAKAWTVREATQRSSKATAEDDVKATRKVNSKLSESDDFAGWKGPRIPLPSSIPDLLPFKKRVFKVPKAPEGVRFYHANTKILLNDDEEYPESDDNMDETWLVQNHDARIAKDPTLSEAAKKFIICYDRHMFREKLSSSRHLGEALVRFSRGNRDFLQRPTMCAEFHKCMANLVCHQCISALTVRVCSEIVQGGDGDAAYGAMEQVKAKAAEKQGVTEEELDGREVAIMEGEDEMEGIKKDQKSMGWRSVTT